VRGKSAGNGGLALAFCRFSPSRNTEELLEGSMSLALTTFWSILLTGVINEDQARRLVTLAWQELYRSHLGP
jgi:hypothetical protein